MFVSKSRIQITIIAIVLVYFLLSLGTFQFLSFNLLREKYSWESKSFNLRHLQNLNLQTSIPPVLHQSWKSTELPSRFEFMVDSWKSVNPSLSHILWTDQDNALFVKTFFPQYYPAWSSFEKAIHQIDSVRYLYMYAFGGIYSDLDTISFKPMLPLLNQYPSDAILAKISSDDSWEHNVPNAWMASKPKHPFWLHVWDLILHKMEHSEDRGAEVLTGPVLLLEALNTWKNENSPVKTLPPGLVYGVDWRNGSKVCADARFDVKLIPECKASFPDIYVLTLWTHTWE